MSDTPAIPRRIAIATHPTMPGAVAPATAIAEYLQGRGVSAVHGLLDNASLLIGRTPGDPTGQVFSWGPFGSSILSAIFWYLLAIWIMRRRDG